MNKEQRRDVTRREALRWGLVASLALLFECGVQRAGNALPKPRGNPVIKDPVAPASPVPVRRLEQIPTEPGGGKPFVRTG